MDNQFDQSQQAPPSSRPVRKNLFLIMAALAFGILLLTTLLSSIQANAAAPALPPASLPDLALEPPGPEVPLANLNIGKTVDFETVRPGGHLVFTIAYTNTTAAPIPNVLIKDTLGRYQIYDCTYVSNPPIPGAQFSCSGDPASGYSFQWTLPSMPAQSSGNIILEVDVVTTTEPVYNENQIVLGNSVQIQAAGFKICLELLVRGSATSVAEVPYVFSDRAAGQSKMSYREAVGYVAQLWQLFWWTRRAHKPRLTHRSFSPADVARLRRTP